MQTQQSTNTVAQLIAECTRDIRWELEQIHTRITADDIERMVDALLEGFPPVWPAALIELQKGRLVHRLTRHLNFHIRHHRGKASARCDRMFAGPFPAFSIKPLLPVARQSRHTCRAAKCIEFVGNTIWGKALNTIKPKLIPFDIKMATLMMKAANCSQACHIATARGDLSRRVRGLLINCLLEWERLLIEQTTSYILQETTEEQAVNSMEAMEAVV